MFELKPSGSKWNETVLYTFTGSSDGGQPAGSLVFDSGGSLYGTASSGGTSGSGVVFKLTPSGGSWTESVLYNFAGGSDGGNPQSGVIFDAAGNSYGTTQFGGLGGGTVFELSPSHGGWTENVLYTFCSVSQCADGSQPLAGLTFDSAGNLYGTTSNGGASSEGVVYKLTQSGSSWTETVLHSLSGSDGAQPHGGVILDQQGVVYGTAKYGGNTACDLGVGCGVVFEITP